MHKPTVLALALSIATTPVVAQTAKPDDAKNPCMVARVALLDAQFEATPLNNTKKKSAAKIKSDIAAAKKQVEKECKPTAALQPHFNAVTLTATFS